MYFPFLAHQTSYHYSKWNEAILGIIHMQLFEDLLNEEGILLVTTGMRCLGRNFYTSMNNPKTLNWKNVSHGLLSCC